MNLIIELQEADESQQAVFVLWEVEQMNRQPSERHIIWSNLSLDVDDWREAYKEFLEANELDADPNDEKRIVRVYGRNKRRVPYR